MKLKNKLVLSLSLLCLVASAGRYTICQGNKDVYNINSKIAQQEDSFSYITRNESEDSNNKIDIQYGGFRGTDSIWNINAKESSKLAINYDSKITNGKFKMVLISPNMKVENILIGKSRGTKAIKLLKGNYRIKIVGSNADGEIKASISKKGNVKITKLTDDMFN